MRQELSSSVLDLAGFSDGARRLGQLLLPFGGTEAHWAARCKGKGKR